MGTGAEEPGPPMRRISYAMATRSARSAAFRCVKAFSCAWEGISYAFTSQRNLKIHLAFAVIAVVLGVALRVSGGGMARRGAQHRARHGT